MDIPEGFIDHVIDPKKMSPTDAMGRCLMLVADSYGLCPVCILQDFIAVAIDRMAEGQLKHVDEHEAGHVH